MPPDRRVVETASGPATTSFGHLADADANCARSRFIADMSHALRRPLSGGIGYGRMLAEEIEEIGDTLLKPRRGGAILVIDGDPGHASRQDMRAGRMSSTLTGDGWTVVEAGDGAWAPDRLDGVTPSLVRRGPTMPVTGGFDVRERPSRGAVPVVVLTVKDVTPRERACLDRQAERIIKGGLGLPDGARVSRELLPGSGL